MEYTKDELTSHLEKHAEWIEAFPSVATTGIEIGQRHTLCIMVYGDEIPQTTRQKILNRLPSLPVEFKKEYHGEAY